MVASPPKVLVASQHARQPPSRGLGPDPAVPSKQERSLPHNAHKARTAYEAVLEMLVVCPDLDVVTFQGQTRQARSSATHGRGCDGAQPSSRGGE